MRDSADSKDKWCLFNVFLLQSPFHKICWIEMLIILFLVTEYTFSFYKILLHIFLFWYKHLLHITTILYICISYSFTYTFCNQEYLSIHFSLWRVLKIVNITYIVSLKTSLFHILIKISLQYLQLFFPTI